MAETINSLKQNFSLRAFLIGMGVVGGFYALLFLYAILNTESTLKQFEGRLPSLTVLVEKEAIAVKEIAPPPPPVAVSEGRMGPPSILQPQNTAIAGTEKLAVAPLPGFFKDSSFGPLPIAKSMIETPYQVYKKPLAANPNGALLSISILNFGLSKSLSDYILKKLPPDVSLILSPYSDNPESFAKSARAKGHEVWLEIPIKNKKFPIEDPGAKALMTNISLRFNEERLHWILGRAAGYAGVAAYSDKALEQAGPMFDILTKDIFSRGLAYLELNTQDDPYIFPIAESLTVPRAKSSIKIDFLDAEEKSFEPINNILTPQSRIVLYINPTPKSIDMLAEWLKNMEQQGVQIVPVSTFADLSVNE